jgi:iron complex outermembrane receptor protein
MNLPILNSQKMPIVFICAFSLLAFGAPATAQEELVLEEVVVTATKREASLQDVPISVVAMSGEKIDDFNIRNLEDLSIYIPNFSKGESGIGPIINIRGIASGANQGFEQSVVTYVDDIPLARAPLSRMPLVDLDRVEVLRGPQNVLFGKNSVAGALSVISARPTDEFEARVSGLYNPEYNDYEAIGIVSGPFSDRVRGRLTIRGAKYNGYYENRLNGNDEEERKEKTIRGMLEFDATDDLEFLFKYEHSSIKGKGLGDEIIAGYDNPWPQSALNPFGGMNFAEAAAFTSFLTGQDIGSTEVSQNRVRDTTVDENFDLKMDTAALIANWDLDSMTFTSVTGWLQYDEDRIYDGDKSGVDVLSQDFAEKYDQFSQEIRFTSATGGVIDWIAGAYYQHWKQKGDEIWSFDDENLLTALGSFPGLGYFAAAGNSVSTKTYKNDSDTWAIFGQLGWNISDTFKMTFGGRYTHESKTGHRFLDIANSETGEFDFVQALTLACVFDNDYNTLGLISATTPLPGCVPGTFVPAGYYPIHNIDGKVSEGKFTPSIIAEWFVRDDNMLYFKADKGFKAGGFDAKGALVRNFEFESESVWAYELGSKNTFLNGRAELNIAVYYMDYSNLQTTTFDGQSAFNVGNAAKATSKGFEVEGRWAATDTMTFFGSLGYLDFKFDEFENASCNAWESLLTGDTVCSRTGDSQSYVPDWSGVVGVDYLVPLSGQYAIRTNFDVSYEGSYFPDSTHEVLIKQDAYFWLNLRVAVEADNWAIALLAKNLTDEDVIEFATTVPNSGVYFGAPAYSGFMKPPRTIALQFDYRF